jgi:hypothetical protein
MMVLKDIYNRNVRLTDERQEHFVTDHPEMLSQIEKLQETYGKRNKNLV